MDNAPGRITGHPDAAPTDDQIAGSMPIWSFTVDRIHCLLNRDVAEEEPDLFQFTTGRAARPVKVVGGHFSMLALIFSSLSGQPKKLGGR